MKPRMKASPEQVELINELVRGDKKAKDSIEYFLPSVLKQVIEQAGLNVIDCPFLPVDEFVLTAKLEIPVILRRKIT